MTINSYPVPAPVFDDDRHIIGNARTTAGAMRHYRRYFAGTSAPAVVAVEKCQPELTGRGPVDGWMPVFRAA